MENQSSYKSSLFHIVLEEYDKLNNKHINELDINNYLKNELRVEFYAFIKHDMDKDIDGTLKRCHYHIVIKCNSSYSKNTIINGISSAMLVNRDIVSVRKVSSFVLMLQYLIHKNDKDKYSYEFMDIWTSNVLELHRAVYEGVSDYDTDINMLYDLVKRCDTLTDIYRELGLKRTRLYRAIILDLWKEKNYLW